MNLSDGLCLLGLGCAWGAVIGYHVGRWHEAVSFERCTRGLFQRKEDK